MDYRVKLSAEIRTSKVSSRGSESKVKVDIKGICQKFENLSSSSENSLNNVENSTPVAPVRKKRSNNNRDSANYSNKNSNDLTLSSKPSNNLSSTRNPGLPSTVKERKMLFESSNKTVSSVHNHKFTKHHNDLSKSKSVDSSKFHSELIKGAELGVSNINTPPAKPPRSFLHTDPTKENFAKERFENPRKNSLIDAKEACESELKGRATSFSFETNVENSASKNSRLGSAPEILSPTAQKAFQSTPKSAKPSGKRQLVFNYLKNISTTANNICEKVKQKHSSIFVDLTPTTVSPPKHYGTLKRSMSEEHIYAEPAVLKSDSNATQSSPAEPLHYMCTPLVLPSSPVQENSDDNKSLSNISVRNMIYGSFAGLRAIPKEVSENISSGSASDSCEGDVSMKAIQDRIIYVKSVRKQVSSSSICLAPKLYEALLIVNVVENQPQIVHSFPAKIDDEYNIPLLPHICFPDNRYFKCASNYQSEVFHFALTDKNENIFGYCLRIQGWPEARSDSKSLCVKLPVAICILSSFSASVFYKKILFEIEKHLTLPRNSCFKYIRSLQKLGVPNAGASLSIPDISEEDDSKRVVISRPLDSHFVGLEMTKALQLLDADILVKCLASLFLERRILFFSSSTRNLYDCCKAISSLLYPFEWPHQIVPVLPACLTIHCCSEQPYILGIVNNCDSVLELLAEHELLIIDVDKGTVIKSCDDEDTILPKKVQKALISALNLAKNMTDPTEMLRDIMISEAFVHMSVEMVGHYENHFTEVNGSMSFQKESFLKHAFSQNIRSFLQWFSETQMFDTFIEDSLWRIKYRNICQTNLRTFFEKRVDEYKWELAHNSETLTRFIGKTVRNFGEMLKGFKKC